MQNSKLLQILQTFDQATMTRWRQFAHSPYHNKHKDVQALCAYLHQCFPKLQGDRVDRKQLFKKVWRGKIPFNQNKLNVLFNYTLKVTEDFLVHERFGQETDVQHIYLLEQLRQRKLEHALVELDRAHDVGRQQRQVVHATRRRRRAIAVQVGVA